MLVSLNNFVLKISVKRATIRLCVLITKRRTDARHERQRVTRGKKTIAEEKEKEGEKKKREKTGRSVRAWSDPPPCSARLVITRQGRREREASKSPYGPLSFPSPFSLGLA